MIFVVLFQHIPMRSYFNIVSMFLHFHLRRLGTVSSGSSRFVGSDGLWKARFCLARLASLWRTLGMQASRSRTGGSCMVSHALLGEKANWTICRQPWPKRDSASVSATESVSGEWQYGIKINRGEATCTLTPSKQNLWLQLWPRSLVARPVLALFF